ncbi:hypothetical protein PPMP20_26260 [Paraburkholderia phymatum]|uniref:Uncharacterized protein n=1 Tax=Paraburkholderia phymatum (strain DSM 17167 / CIP 108236 / LMG 21445 / STM815) TaxID=391038 RepID=B2JLK0_PARP8|nr:hypothetical protein [Paraburkholderia phymatum]ACC72633.1 hypothetical protein Bphy_3484 [Paraburkholderia phymatum STM815]
MLEHIDPVVLVAVLRTSSSPLFSAWIARASSYEPWIEDTCAHHLDDADRRPGTAVGSGARVDEVRHV